MSTRQARRERREAERKAKKAELKRLKAEGLNETAGQTVLPSAIPESEEFSPEDWAMLQAARERYRPRRAEINRANAQHSTGPRTESGKLASSRNSLKHGLASGELIISGEDPAAYEALLEDLLAEHQPVNPTEELLVEQMAQSWWLAQRALRLQNECFTSSGIDEKRLALFLRYQTGHDRAFHKALNSLLRLQKERRKNPVGFVSQNTEKPKSFTHKSEQNALMDCPNQPRSVSDGLAAPCEMHF